MFSKIESTFLEKKEFRVKFQILGHLGSNFEPQYKGVNCIWKLRSWRQRSDERCLEVIKGLDHFQFLPFYDFWLMKIFSKIENTWSVVRIQNLAKIPIFWKQWSWNSICETLRSTRDKSWLNYFLRIIIS